MSWSTARTRFLITVGSPSSAGALYYWDTDYGNMQFLSWTNPKLKGQKLSPVRTLRYPARDGTKIPMFVRRPAACAEPCPVIVSLYGGQAGFDPYAQVTHNVYALLRSKARLPGLKVEEAHREALIRGFGLPPDADASDGIVPTLSQPWGEIITAVWADHLDVIGHFDGPYHAPPHVDWLISTTGFRRAEFEVVWERVTNFVLES